MTERELMIYAPLWKTDGLSFVTWQIVLVQIKKARFPFDKVPLPNFDPNAHMMCHVVDIPVIHPITIKKRTNSQPPLGYDQKDGALYQ